MHLVSICEMCRGARWVDSATLEPWHPGHPGYVMGESTGTPCFTCNPGPEFEPWNMVCLGCATEEEFVTTNDDDPDAILAELDFDFDEPDDTLDASKLSDADLSEHFNAVRDELIEIGEMHHPRTDKGRELHSRRTAYLVEMQTRPTWGGSGKPIPD